VLKGVKLKKVFSVSIIILLCLYITGCATTYPKNFLKLSDDNLQVRQLQMRQFETTKEKEVILASAGVLQDMGFTLDDSETELGLIVASKDRDATNAGQVTLATMSVILSALGGSSSNAFDNIDKVQKIRASVVTKLNAEGNKTIVRVTFQRIVWNNVGNVSRMETLNEPGLYQGFFEKVSKAIFLEEQKI
jgi:hypothetical protein